MSSSGNHSSILDWVPTDSKTGEYQRKPSAFRDQISSASGARFPPEANRYHLFVSLACPWAHRTLITRELKGLRDIISVSVVHWHLGEEGWRFSTDEEAVVHETSVGEFEQPAGPEPIVGARFLKDIYFKTEPNYDGRYTVPTLWDKKTAKIVNNESSEIIRMLYTEFDGLLGEEKKTKGVTYLPNELKANIEEMNEWVYPTVNNGVYRSGFAITQEAYETAVLALFASLDRLEDHLAQQTKGPYLFGEKLTEADIRLYPTIVRFDPMYVQHFKTNLKMIRHDYPHLHRWMRHLFWEVPAFGATTNFEHIRKHFTKSHKQINPRGITPLGPVPDIQPLDK